MPGSLKDQLLALGFKPASKGGDGPRPKTDEEAGRRSGAGRPRDDGRRPQTQPGGPAATGTARAKRGPSNERRPATDRDDGEIDLAKAYALRAKAEREEKERLAREAAEKARLKAERKEKVARLLEGAALNLPEAEHPRHFEYGGKIRRVYVDEAQLAALNRGELAVVQHKGRFLVVTRETALAVQAVEPALLALLVDPDASGDEDLAADPPA
jgi:uncharacterized protein YaiL (DUF2058 family)